MQTRNNHLSAVFRYCIVYNRVHYLHTDTIYYAHTGAEFTEPVPHSLQADRASYGRFATLTQDLTSLVESMCAQTVTYRI